MPDKYTLLEEYEKLRKKYFLAFIAIIALTCMTQAVIQYYIFQQKEASEIVNLAGRQRMLSQRILAKLSLQKNLPEKNYTAEATDAIELLQSTHLWLKKQTLEENTSLMSNPGLGNQFSNLDSLLASFIQSTQCPTKDCLDLDLELVSKNSNAFLDKMNQLVFGYDNHFAGEILFLSRVEIGIFLLIVSILLFELFVLLLPFHKKMKEQQVGYIHDTRLATLGELSASLAHEINNPLSIIELATEKISRKSDSPEAVEKSVSKIQKALTRIQKISKNMKNFSSNVSTELKEKHALKDIIENSVHLSSFQNKSVSIDVNTCPDLYIQGTDVQLEQILINLITNAIHAMEAMDNAKIEIGFIKVDKHIQILVSDNGPGVPEEIKDKIFSSFFTTKEKGKGTGLGLSISKKIAEEHSGDLTLEDRDGKSLFVLSLPYC